VNRLRMVIRSHEVPKSLTGVQVQHDGRLVTIFSASNYCGRIGNTGGTMLLTPQLDYQLMEHWAPSVAELLQMEEEEAATSLPSPIEKPAEKRRSFSSAAQTLMKADILQKMKDLVAEHKSELLAAYEAADHAKSDVLPLSVVVQTLRDVAADLPWEEHMAELCDVGADSRVRYRAFLSRYRVAHDNEGWQAEMFSQLHDALCKRDLKDTFAFFDTNEDGKVTSDELLAVLSRFAIGASREQLESISSQLMGGQTELRTATLLSHFQAEYSGLATTSGSAREPPAWAKQLLDTVSRQCAMRKRDALQLFRSFDVNGDGFISFDEFQKAMLKLGGYDSAALDAEQRKSIEQMLVDLGRWVDHTGAGVIPYIDFINAFRLSTTVDDAAPPPPPPPLRAGSAAAARRASSSR